ncbi:MAG: translation initiation factor IF-2 [Mycoplasmataceae bacterium]|nr:translation initiation factor IF-2 [Mycoplasmataceae bacterium]
MSKNINNLDLASQVKINKTRFENNTLYFKRALSVLELAKLINKQPTQIIKILKREDMNNDTVLNEEDIGEVCIFYGFDFNKEVDINEKEVFNHIDIVDDPNDLETRAPIVTIMGHIDHGKTTLLDYIKKTRLQQKEVGGITQSIGAYQIKYNNSPITFIDTPGHEAFNNMRVQGANITDIIVIVVAADDGVNKQTVESIKIAKQTKLPIIVFINKMDKPNINSENILNQLTDNDLMPEEWGGTTMIVKGSAITGMGVDQLLETIILQSEMREYKANYKRMAIGTIIESGIKKGLGAYNTAIIKNGTLHKGDFVIAGSSFGKIKIMFDENNKEVKDALPSTPVMLIGLNKPASSGQKFIVSTDERQMKELASKVNEIEKQEISFNNEVVEGHERFNVIIKSDAYGSMEAINHLLSQIKIEGVDLVVVSSGIGGISESDVTLAKTAKAIIIGFNVKPTNDIKEWAKKSEVKILFYDIIYKLQDEVMEMMTGALKPVEQEIEIGEAVIQQIWEHSKVGTIAGCKCTSGEITRKDNARVLRDGVVLYKTKIGSMKHFKDEVAKISNEQEFGITLEKINDLKVGDIIQCYKLTK